MALVIGIDPGAEMSAMVSFDGQVRDATYKSNLGILRILTANLNPPCIEMPESRGKTVSQSVLDTACWVGRFDYDCEATLYKPREIRAHFCGTSNSTRSQVRQDLIDRLGPVGKKPNPGPLYMIGRHEKVGGESVTEHLWDALAVAVMGYDMKMDKGA